ncbi:MULTISPECIES: LppU/SCO3897 family protein [Streptomyces]|uniref:LppU/SCO3897 family protein n=1 Tax=Streptomyces TaxID=1883 RepID=UPI0006EBA17C|nr:MULTISPECIES: hypothetical protein [Streptomyces]MCF3122048.1 hypothetical protein [Streptomyces arenae]
MSMPQRTQQTQGRRTPRHFPQGGGGGAFAGLSPLMKVGVLVIAAIIAGVWMYTSRGNTTGPDSESAKAPAVAEIGDCVQNKGSEGSPDMEVIDCGDTKAEYKVESKNEQECEPGQSRFEQTRRGRVQFSMCLSQVAAK